MRSPIEMTQIVAIKGNVSVAEVTPQASHTPTHLNEIQMQLIRLDVITRHDTPYISPIEKAQTMEIKDEVVGAEAAQPQASAYRTPLDEIQMLLAQQYVSINAVTIRLHFLYSLFSHKKAPKKF